jgi:hypothetical protein
MDKSPDWSGTNQCLIQQCTEIQEKNMVTKKEKAQASKRSGSGARGKPHTGGGRDQQGGGKEASSGDRSKGGGQPGGGKTGGQGG